MSFTTSLQQFAGIDIEICVNCDDLSTLAIQVQAAKAGCATRLELCGAMHEQGLTPTVEAVKIARQAWGNGPGLVAMLRPRGGDFYYQADDVALMQQQLSALAAAGADAVVLGVLRQSSDGQIEIDWPLLNVLLAQAADLSVEVNFHRAFDVLPIPTRAAALQRLQQLGIARVLTAGCAWDSGFGALEGVPQLQQDLQQTANAQAPQLVIGGGVTLSNVAMLRKQLMQLTQLTQLSSMTSTAGCYSFHCYSAVLTDGRVDQHKVAALVATAAIPHIFR
ncbi:copper homeostasis protein CutC [Rheinheimera riviphila]|nr:copper homeostasis protein CutC [Rheinheimera riviphila]